MQSVPINTKVVSSNPIHGEVYSTQHYVIKFVSDLGQVWFSQVSSTNKTDCHNITEILLKVELNTINQTNLLMYDDVNEHKVTTIGHGPDIEPPDYVICSPDIYRPETGIALLTANLYIPNLKTLINLEVGHI